jgi:hypothetical protein
VTDADVSAAIVNHVRAFNDRDVDEFAFVRQSRGPTGC